MALSVPSWLKKSEIKRTNIITLIWKGRWGINSQKVSARCAVHTRDRFLFLPIWGKPAWCIRKSLGKYNFRSISGYFIHESMEGERKKKEWGASDFCVFHCGREERSSSSSNSRVIFQISILLSKSQLYNCVSQPHGAFYLRPSKKSADSNNHSPGNVDWYYSDFSCGATLKKIWLQAEPEQLCFTHINCKNIFRIMEKIT